MKAKKFPQPFPQRLHVLSHGGPQFAIFPDCLLRFAVNDARGRAATPLNSSGSLIFRWKPAALPGKRKQCFPDAGGQVPVPLTLIRHSKHCVIGIDGGPSGDRDPNGVFVEEHHCDVFPLFRRKHRLFSDLNRFGRLKKIRTPHRLAVTLRILKNREISVQSESLDGALRVFIDFTYFYSRKFGDHAVISQLFSGHTRPRQVNRLRIVGTFFSQQQANRGQNAGFHDFAILAEGQVQTPAVFVAFVSGFRRHVPENHVSETLAYFPELLFQKLPELRPAGISCLLHADYYCERFGWRMSGQNSGVNGFTPRARGDILATWQEGQYVARRSRRSPVTAVLTESWNESARAKRLRKSPKISASLVLY